MAVAAGGLAAIAAARLDRRSGPVLVAAREAGRRWPRLRAMLASRLDPEPATGLALTVAVVVMVAGGLVLGVLTFVIRDTNALSGVDAAVARWGDRHATAWSTDGLHGVTALGATWMAIAVCVIVVLLDRRIVHSWRTALFLLVVIGGDKLLTTTVKELVDRVRPDLNPIAETLGPSFPSGHSSTAAALWAAVALVASRWLGRGAVPALAGLAVGVAVAVAASRVLLDVHWLTDVIGGLALGWAWFALCAVAFGGRVLRFGATARAAAAVSEPG
jgi:membrane-associated phospholipid phosphatase